MGRRYIKIETCIECPYGLVEGQDFRCRKGGFLVVNPHEIPDTCPLEESTMRRLKTTRLHAFQMPDDSREGADADRLGLVGLHGLADLW